MPNTIPVLSPFNPLDKRNLAESVARAMLQRPICQLPPEPFIGAGIYAIYYTGKFPLYEKIAKKNRGNLFAQPIYVGKAVPAGARKGGFGLGNEPGQALYKRLCDHAKSVAETGNLNAKDFFCRFLAVDDIWIPLAESLLIEMFEPLWNRVMDGFGNHNPGKGRYEQKMSQWDSIHPGRLWAARLKKLEVSEFDLSKSVKDFIAAHYNG
mgnify:FL=1